MGARIGAYGLLKSGFADYTVVAMHARARLAPVCELLVMVHLVSSCNADIKKGNSGNNIPKVVLDAIDSLIREIFEHRGDYALLVRRQRLFDHSRRFTSVLMFLYQCFARL